MRALVTAFVCLVNVLAFPLVSSAELIEPTRTLQGKLNATGNLTILSEPPKLDVTLNDNQVGKTPILLKQLESGVYRLNIQESETEIYVGPGKDVKISLFKGEFIILPDEKKEPVKRQRAKEKKVEQARSIPPTKHAEQKKELTPWEQFVDGSLNHF